MTVKYMAFFRIHFLDEEQKEETNPWQGGCTIYTLMNRRLLALVCSTNLKYELETELIILHLEEKSRKGGV